MPDNDALIRLRQITDEILALDTSQEDLSRSVTQLYSFFTELTGLNRDSADPEVTMATQLDSGLAISPGVAAGCLLDAFRTAQFLRATNAAIKESQNRFPGVVIEILYAGCGPYAPLALPLATRFTPDEVQFTLLDIHQRSLDTAWELFNRLGVGDFVRDFKQCDASSYTHPAPGMLHLVITETMQAALLNETQVSIAMNVAPQLCPGGMMIPESIVIDACLWNLTYQPPDVLVGRGDPAQVGLPAELRRIPLGRVAEFTLETCRDLSNKLGANLPETGFLPAGLVETPDAATEDFYLTLLTTLTVFDRFRLSEYESLLTYPIVMHDLGKIRGGMKIEFYYQLGAKPRFKCRLVNNGETRDSPG
jgi:hypothetical protein